MWATSDSEKAKKLCKDIVSYLHSYDITMALEGVIAARRMAEREEQRNKSLYDMATFYDCRGDGAPAISGINPEHFAPPPKAATSEYPPTPTPRLNLDETPP